MDRRKGKRQRTPKITPKKAGILAVCIILAVLVIALCISVVMRSNIQSEYSQARNVIGDELYAELYMFTQTFDQVSVAGQDLQNDVIPTMEDYYLAAKTLNDALVNAFGSEFGVLSQAETTSIDDAFDAFYSAFKGGKSTDEAESAMASCIESILTVLDERYPDDVLVAAS